MREPSDECPHTVLDDSLRARIDACYEQEALQQRQSEGEELIPGREVALAAEVRTHEMFWRRYLLLGSSAGLT